LIVEKKGKSMTEHELEILQLKLKIHSLKTVMAWMLDCYAIASPESKRDVLAALQGMRNTSYQVSPKLQTPAESDLVAGEFQDAMEETLGFFEDHINRKFAPTNRR
jgi:hypothetical protein